MPRVVWRVANYGSYPRVGDSPTQQALRRAHADFDRGLKTEDDLRAAQDQAVREAIRDQIEAGCDLITDGMVRWHDAVSHPMRLLPGVEINGLLRYFDTNTYFRQPVVRDRLRTGSMGLVEEYRFAAAASGGMPVKPVITGPYTLAALSIRAGSPYTSVAALSHDLSVRVADEVARLADAGARMIQIDEPSILRSPGDIQVLADALETIASQKKSARLVLAATYGDATPLYELFQRLPVEMLAFDLTYGEALLETIGRVGTRRDIALGCVDARNTRREDPARIAGAIRRVLGALEGRTVHLTPSAGLEYLPKAVAREKLRRLTEIKGLLDQD